MNIKLHLKNDINVAGTTLKDPNMPEAGNMGLHVSRNADDVIGNRKKLAAFLNCSPEDFVCAYQTHSANFCKVTSADRGRGSASMEDAIPDTDALYTFEMGLVLCCFTADCVPVMLYDKATGMTGVIHSGWVGTVKEITQKVLYHLIEKEHCRKSDIRVAIGPAISPAKFEVDEDVYEQFKALGYANEFICYNELTHKYHIDNQLVVKKQCELQGISSQNITIDKTCTFTSPFGFSYRQDKNSGRHLSFILRKK